MTEIGQDKRQILLIAFLIFVAAIVGIYLHGNFYPEFCNFYSDNGEPLGGCVCVLGREDIEPNNASHCHGIKVDFGWE